MLNAATKKTLADLGINEAGLTAAIAAPAEVAFPITLKTGEIKLSDTATIHIYDSAGHDGFKGRVKADVLAQATELGVKAVAAEAGVDYKGNDPKKLLEAVTAKLNIPIADQVKEKDKDIATMTTNWNTEKTAREAAETRYNERLAFDNAISFFPDNRAKNFKDKTYHAELKEEGITIGEYEVSAGVKKPAIFIHGEVQKNTDLTLKDPKDVLAEHFKTKAWVQPDAPAGAPAKRTFDTPGAPGAPGTKFDHDSAYKQAIAADGGRWGDKAQAVYTDLQLAASAKPATA